MGQKLRWSALGSDHITPSKICFFLLLFYVSLLCSLVYLCINFTCYIVPDGSVIYFKRYGVAVTYFEANTVICMEGLRKVTINLNQDSRSGC